MKPLNMQDEEKLEEAKLENCTCKKVKGLTTTEEKIYVCPECAYAASKNEITYGQYDYDCPRCKTKKMSSFLPYGNHDLTTTEEKDVQLVFPEETWIEIGCISDPCDNVEPQPVPPFEYIVDDC